MDLQALSSYAREIRHRLPAHVFSPVRSRLAWLALHVSVIAVGIVGIALNWGGPWAWPIWSLVIGHSFAGAAFVGHETMHGAVVRSPGARLVVGWLSFLPFTLSPRLWVAWHNRTHHGHTMKDGIDPDAYPTLRQYRQSRVTRVADAVSFGVRRPLGVVATLLLGFTGQSTQMLWRWSKTSPLLDRRERRLAIVETLLGIATWAAIGVLVGPLHFLFAFVLPLFVGNAIVMGYILTNHSLSPYTDINDPLVNTLSVEVPRLVAWMHLQFGLHVEHHLFPSMSSHHAPLVRDLLVEHWPERYQSMPLLRALGLLVRTPRVYGTPTTLVDPRTGQEAATLQPRSTDVAPAPAVEEASIQTDWGCRTQPSPST